MNVLIVTEEDVFYVYEFFRHFYSRASGAPYKICGTTILAPFNKKSTRALARQMYGFYGPVNFVRMGFLFVLRKLLGHSVAGLTRKNGIELWETGKVNSDDFITRVAEHNIDVIVSIAAPQIFRKKLLGTPSRGCINSHSALLPENKGMMPVFWGLYKGGPEIGVTIHFMSEDLDGGDIIRQERVPVTNRNLHKNIIETKRISARLIDEVLREMSTGEVSRTPMPPGGSSQTFPTPAEVAEFKKRGGTLL